MPEPRCLEVSVAQFSFRRGPFTEACPKKKDREKIVERGFSERLSKERRFINIVWDRAEPLGPRGASVSTRKSSIFFISPKHTSSVDSAPTMWRIVSPATSYRDLTTAKPENEISAVYVIIAHARIKMFLDPRRSIMCKDRVICLYVRNVNFSISIKFKVISLKYVYNEISYYKAFFFAKSYILLFFHLYYLNL